MEILERVAPPKIAGPTLWIALARRGPALDVLTAHGDAQRLGGVRRHACQHRGHATAIDELRGFRPAVDLDTIRIASVRRIDFGNHLGKAVACPVHGSTAVLSIWPH